MRDPLACIFCGAKYAQGVLRTPEGLRRWLLGRKETPPATVRICNLSCAYELGALVGEPKPDPQAAPAA